MTASFFFCHVLPRPMQACIHINMSCAGCVQVVVGGGGQQQSSISGCSVLLVVTGWRRWMKEGDRHSQVRRDKTETLADHYCTTLTLTSPNDAPTRTFIIHRDNRSTAKRRGNRFPHARPGTRRRRPWQRILSMMVLHPGMPLLAKTPLMHPVAGSRSDNLD